MSSDVAFPLVESILHDVFGRVIDVAAGDALFKMIVVSEHKTITSPVVTICVVPILVAGRTSCFAWKHACHCVAVRTAPNTIDGHPDCATALPPIEKN